MYPPFPHCLRNGKGKNIACVSVDIAEASLFAHPTPAMETLDVRVVKSYFGAFSDGT